MTQRSVDVDSENHSLSVLDEYEAKEVLELIAQDSRVAGNVWGDIYRNRFLASFRDPPSSLTPAGEKFTGNEIFHGSIKVDKIKQSGLCESFVPPEHRRKQGSLGVAYKRSSEQSAREKELMFGYDESRSYGKLFELGNSDSSLKQSNSSSFNEKQKHSKIIMMLPKNSDDKSMQQQLLMPEKQQVQQKLPRRGGNASI